VVGEEWVLQILVNLPVTGVPGCVSRNAKTLGLTLLSRSLSKCYLRIQSVPQREHHTSPLQRSTC
jgi:hypothetical protein